MLLEPTWRSPLFLNWGIDMANLAPTRNRLGRFSTPTDAAASFWAKANRKGPGECWLWLGAAGNRYGVFRHAGRVMGSHRWALTLAIGELPRGVFVCHRCDRPLCCNPEHLFVGTPQENSDDCSAKGRRRCKLSDDDVLKIRALVAGGTMSNRAIGRAFGVSHHAIRDIAVSRFRKFVGSQQAIDSLLELGY